MGLSKYTPPHSRFKSKAPVAPRGPKGKRPSPASRGKLKKSNRK